MRMEILAPVGNMDSLVAAVRTGADAVYFGAEEFNARRNANNFDNENLKNAIAYCKHNEVKCYLTLNTLIKDEEMQKAVSLAVRAFNFGIDAIIVQDIGLASLLKEKAPQMVLHASTQMSVHSAAALPFLKKLGFKRVVPAREMSETELKIFCQKAKELDIEVEVFVHGALCMCISGQCYFSAFLGGRSANRGLCAGTCRLPFNAKGGTGYDLSLKDLSLINHLDSLGNMGVASLKIEGRMTRPEYVAVTVDALKQTLENGKVSSATLKLLEDVFSRDGFTDGYFKNSLGKDMFGVRSEEDKTVSKSVLSSIHELYRRERQRLALDFEISIKENAPCSVTVKYKLLSATVLGGVPEKAIKVPLEKSKVVDCFNKLGGTCYFTNNINLELDADITISISSLNALKKEAVEKLDFLRCFERNISDIKIEKALIIPQKSAKGFFARFNNAEQLIACKEALNSLVGYSLPYKKIISSAKKSIENKSLFLNAVAELPRASFDDSSTLLALNELKRIGIKKVVCNNLAELCLASDLGFDIMCGFGLNAFNSFSLSYLSGIGVKNIVISSELSFNEIGSLCYNDAIKTYGICYGYQPLMLTRNCPVKNGVGCKGKKDFCQITDRLGNKFPVICDNGISEILNTKITDISDHLHSLNVDYGYIFFTIESGEDAKKITLDLLSNKSHYGSDFTRGLYKNGVK